MQDMYGLLIILGLLIVISQCINREKENFENLNSNNYANTDNEREKKLPQVVDQKPTGKRNVFSYNPGEILLTDANAPYGFNVPQSMMQEFALLRNAGNSTDKPVSQASVMGEFARFVPVTSQYAGFDPTSKGGLLRNQVGSHVTKANTISNNLQRNIANMNNNYNTNSNIVPLNSNENFHASNVNSNRNANKNSIINRNTVTLKEGYDNMNNSNTMNVFMIYADWCPHSRNALPAFNDFKNEFNGSDFNGYKLNIDEFDVEKDKQLSKQYNKIQGYPTVVVSYGDNYSDYQPIKGRDKDSILESLKKLV